MRGPMRQLGVAAGSPADPPYPKEPRGGGTISTRSDAVTGLLSGATKKKYQVLERGVKVCRAAQRADGQVAKGGEAGGLPGAGPVPGSGVCAAALLHARHAPTRAPHPQEPLAIGGAAILAAGHAIKGASLCVGRRAHGHARVLVRRELGRAAADGDGPKGGHHAAEPAECAHGRALRVALVVLPGHPVVTVAWGAVVVVLLRCVCSGGAAAGAGACWACPGAEAQPWQRDCAACQPSIPARRRRHRSPHAGRHAQ